MRVIVLAALILILVIYNVNALAVASDFLEDDTLVLVEGESKLYEIRVQNPTQQEIKVKITYDESFLEIIDQQDEYTIPPETNYPILFNVSTRNAKVNQIYTLSYTVHQLSGSGPGLPMLIKIAKSFNLKVVKDPNKFYISDLYKYYPQFIIVLLIIFFLVRKKLNITEFRNRKNIFKSRKIIK